MSKSLVEIKGFAELQSKIKQLPDKIKKREMLKVLKQVATSTVNAVKTEAPKGIKDHTRFTGVTKGKRRKRVDISKNDIIDIKAGNVSRSIGKIVGKRGLGKENAVVYVGARSKGRKDDGYYAHMIVKKGTKGKKRKGRMNEFINRGYQKTKAQVTADAETKVTRWIQKEINKLSK